MFSIVLHNEADAEFAEAAVWYETQKEGLGNSFIEAINSQLNLIIQYPESFPVKWNGFREAVVPVFPYIIAYKLFTEHNTILVASIFHAKRQPGKKYRHN